MPEKSHMCIGRALCLVELEFKKEGGGGGQGQNSFICFLFSF